MDECMMPGCKGETLKRSALCDWHHERAYPTEVGMDYIRAHIERENESHAKSLADGTFRRLSECVDIDDGVLRPDGFIRLKTVKVDPEAMARLFDVPPELLGG